MLQTFLKFSVKMCIQPWPVVMYCIGSFFCINYFSQYALGGRVFLRKKKEPPFFTKLPSWENYLKKAQYTRNRNQVGCILFTCGYSSTGR